MSTKPPILVVDSEPATLKALFKLLRDDGHSVLVAASSQAALRMMRKHRPGLVLLADRHSTPQETTFCRRVKIQATHWDIPAVLFGRSLVAATNERAGRAANKPTVKALDVDELRARIRTIVRLQETMAVLRASELHQRQLVEILPAGMILVDVQGRLRHANRQAARILDYSNRGLLLRRSLFDLTRSQDHPRLRADMETVLKQGSFRNAEYEILKSNGRACPMELSAAVWQDAGQQPTGLVILVRDVSEQKQAKETVRELQGILNQTQDAIMIRDLKGVIHYANEGAERLLGWKQPELCGRNVRMLLFDDLAAFDAAQKQLRRHGEWHGELRVIAKDGRRLIVQSRWTLVRGINGEAQYVVAVTTDVTERKRTEESLREREQLSHRIIETALHGFWMTDLTGRIQDVNAAYCRMSGYTRKELMDMQVSDLEANEPTPVLVAGHIKRLIRAGSIRFETRHRRKDGSIFDLEVSATYLGLGGGLLFAFLNDITERKQLEEERRHFSRQIMAIQEAERARVGRELHDSVNQIVASAKMRLRNVERHAEELGPATRTILARCDQLLAQALEENRRISRNLHPGHLDELGLPEACRILCQELESRTSMSVKTAAPRWWPQLTPSTELNLFRIVQESLNNVEQHAKAKSVQLQLALQKDGIVLKICDDGRGFDANRLKAGKQKQRGIGLVNMRERAATLGGTCQVVSAPKRGTTVTIWVPGDVVSPLHRRGGRFQQNVPSPAAPHSQATLTDPGRYLPLFSTQQTA